MDEDGSGSPSEIISFHFSDLNKKRKLQADQFGLPISKHNCWGHRLSPKPLAIWEETQPVEDLIMLIAKKKAEGDATEYGSEPESGKDSNSFVGDYESTTSVHRDAKFETYIPKLWPSNAPSTSAAWSSNNVKHCLLDDAADIGVTASDEPLDDAEAIGVTASDEPVYEEEEHDPCNYYNEIQAYQNLGDGIMGDIEYTCYGHGIGSIEPFIDKDVDNVLYSKKVKPNSPVLSSGSWSVNQAAEPGRKPTIDQEFEQYFSTLML